MTRTCLAWIQPHPHGAILRHILKTVKSFLCSSTNYLKNQLLTHGGDEDDVRDTKDVLESPRDTHTKLKIQSNSEF
jgi:hypothetical protein